MAVSHFFGDWQVKEDGPRPWWDLRPSRTTCLQLCPLCCRTQPQDASRRSITLLACPLLLRMQLPYLFLPCPSIVFCFMARSL